MKVLTRLILLFSLFSLHAQNNKLIDEFLSREFADFNTAAYLVLVASGSAPESLTLDQARQKVLEANWGITEVHASQPLNAATLSLLIMKGLNLSGGLFYSLFGGGWYAFKEARYRQLFPAHYSPWRVLKGWEAINALTKALEMKEAVDNAR